MFIFVNPEGSWNDVIALQFLNKALLPPSAILDFSGRFTVFSAVQPLNTSPHRGNIALLSGKVTDDSAVQRANPHEPIPVISEPMLTDTTTDL